MEINKVSGCPNCKTEKSALVWSVDEFRPYRSLNFVGKYGSCTELFCCSECNTKYIRVDNGHLYHLLHGQGEKFFLEFFNTINQLSQKNDEIVNSVGSPQPIFEFPVRVKTKDGSLLPYAVVARTEYIWPISLNLATVRLISEVDEIFPSDEAMTLYQRIAAHSVHEIQMGVSPIWLRKNEKVYMTNYRQFFIPSKYGAPSEFAIETGINRPMPLFDSVPVTYFIGPP